MLEGLIQAYLDGFGRAWCPRDTYVLPNGDSIIGRNTLSSPANRRGEADEFSPHNRRIRSGGGI